MERCQKCGNKIRGQAYSTPLRSRVCASCHDQVNGAIIGYASGGGLGGAYTGPGILKWIRGSLHPAEAAGPGMPAGPTTPWRETFEGGGRVGGLLSLVALPALYVLFYETDSPISDLCRLGFMLWGVLVALAAAPVLLSSGPRRFTAGLVTASAGVWLLGVVIGGSFLVTS